MEAKDILRRLKRWRDDWDQYLKIDEDHGSEVVKTFNAGGNSVKRFTMRRLNDLIKDIEKEVMG